MVPDISTVPIELCPVGDIKAYPFNNKKHPPKHIDQLARSIKVHGLHDPISVDENMVIVSGHGRLEAVKSLGFVEVPVRILRGLSEEQIAALRIAVNKTVSTDYDVEMLQREVYRLSATPIDMGSIGLDAKELQMMLEDVGEIDSDALVADMDAALEEHDGRTTQKAEEADEGQVRLDKAFGFKTIPLRAQKTVTRFLAQAEEETGKAGVDALLEHMRTHMKRAS